MNPPDPFPPPPRTGDGGPARVASALIHQLAQHGITGVYTASTDNFAVISVAADLTVWTNGRQLWCTYRDQRYTWLAANVAAAAIEIATLAHPPGRP
jgi:hypothetical protein